MNTSPKLLKCANGCIKYKVDKKIPIMPKLSIERLLARNIDIPKVILAFSIENRKYVEKFLTNSGFINLFETLVN